MDLVYLECKRKNMAEIKKILVANRGEIAVRIIRTIKHRNLRSVAVFSDADFDEPYVNFADEAIGLGGVSAADSYLNQDKIIAAARQTGADAIHPGYGFLAENASFARRCRKEGIIFIGPTPEVIEKLGSKAAAKEIMRQAGVPVVPGYEGEDQSLGRFKYEAGEIGFPVLLKASAGGGGKGMRIVNSESELETALEAASREAEKSFGDGTLLMEKYFPKAKHIEFQILGDEQGNYIHVYERECSMQRRYQKIIEESPSPSLTPELREEMGNAALEVAKAVQYTNAGTVEFLLDENGDYYFLEVNTRLQVEHPVTELTVGCDLVSLQIDIAQGKPIPFKQEELQPYGHSIECRICAEDPENNFLPSTGELLTWIEGATPLQARFDSGVIQGSTVSIHYDSMLAKAIVLGATRQNAINAMVNILKQTVALGITTNINFLKELLTHPAFVDGSFDTKLIEREFSEYKTAITQKQIHECVMAALLYAWETRKVKQPFAASLNGWRNIFYQPQTFRYEFKGEIIDASYKTLTDSKLKVNIAGTEYMAETAIASNHVFYLRINNHLQHFHIAFTDDNVYVHHPEVGAVKLRELPRFADTEAADKKDGYYAPMPGEVVKVLVKPGDAVKSGQRLLIMNSMKMETTIEAHSDGIVEDVLVSEKSFVEANTPLLKIKQK
jgi:acetyl-CoA carboxylase biotin carboxylase subunit